MKFSISALLEPWGESGPSKIANSLICSVCQILTGLPATNVFPVTKTFLVQQILISGADPVFLDHPRQQAHLNIGRSRLPLDFRPPPPTASCLCAA